MELLFELINKMTKAEKRNFKLYVSKYGANKSENMILLFDFINKLKEYDEDKLKQKFAHKVSEKTFNYEKFRLKNLIINSLTDLHFNGGNELSIGEIITKIEVGIRLEMPIIAEEWFKKGYKFQQTTKDPLLLVILKTYEFKFLVKEKKVHSDTPIAIGTEAAEACRLLEQKLNFQKLTRQFSQWYLKYIRNKTEEGEKERIKLINSSIFNSDESKLELILTDSSQY